MGLTCNNISDRFSTTIYTCLLGSETYRFEDDRTRHRAALRSQNLQVSHTTDQTHISTINHHDKSGYLNPQDGNPSTNPVPC
jgi:hypothetical protein